VRADLTLYLQRANDWGPAEAETARVGRLRNAGPGGGFLRDGDGARRRCIGDLVHLADEVDGAEILVAAVAVGNPLSGFARVVEIEHRRDRIDPQAVEVEALEPEAGIGDEKAHHLLALEVVDVGAPILVESQTRVGMLIKMRAVEIGKTVRIVRKMRRHPIEDDPDPGRMRRLDEGREILRRAEAARRRIKGDRLIAPGPVEGEFGDRQ